MRRLLLLGVLLLTGCSTTDGPFRRNRSERVDDPYYSVQEQQRRGRAGLSLPDETLLGGPSSGTTRQLGSGR